MVNFLFIFLEKIIISLDVLAYLVIFLIPGVILWKIFAKPCSKNKKKLFKRILILTIIAISLFTLDFVTKKMFSVCIHETNFPKPIIITGTWSSKNDYLVDIKTTENEPLDSRHPIFETQNYCQLYLKENNLSFKQFSNQIKKIAVIKDQSGATRSEKVLNQSLPFTIEITYNPACGWGGLFCGLPYHKHPPCFFHQFEKETDPNKAFEICKKTKLSKTDKSKCYYCTALKMAKSDPDKALKLCKKKYILESSIKSCYIDVVKIVSKYDKEKALEFCQRPKAPSSCKKVIEKIN